MSATHNRLPRARSRDSASYPNVLEVRLGMLKRNSRLTRSAPELTGIKVFYYDGEPLQIREELMNSANSIVYKVRSPPLQRKTGVLPQVKVCEIHCDESPKSILKVCTHDGTWKSKKDYNAEETALLKITPHENIVQCYGVVTDNPNNDAQNTKIGFLMEYCPEGNLQNYLSKNTITIEKVLSMVNEIIKPIIHLHKLNIIHRDIKSPNYLVSSGVVKLCDFGLCREDTPYNRSTTFKKTRSGPVWTAPEVYDYDIDDASDGDSDSDNKIKYSFKSDVYSVTMVIWEVLNTLFSKQYSPPISGNIYKVMAQVLKGKRPSLANFPTDWVSILEKGWSQNADDRPTIEELYGMVQNKN